MQNKLLQQIPEDQREKLRTQIPADLYIDEAQRRVQIGLLFSELINKFQVTTDSDMVKAKVDEVCASYEKPDEIAKQIMSNKQQLSSVEAQVLEKQVFDKLLEQVKIADESMSYQDLMAFELPKDEKAKKTETA